MPEVKDHNLKCPECGAPMKLGFSKKYPLKGGIPRPFYSCTLWPHCDGSHGAHPDGKPLGVPANKETKLARRAAHAAMELYQDMTSLKTGQIYAELKEHFKTAVHIGELNIERCKKVERYFNNRIIEVGKGRDKLYE